MVDLFSVVVTKAFEWGIGKALDVMWKCTACSQQDAGRIENVTHNHFLCSNCHKCTKQFSSAHGTTVIDSGHLRQIGVTYDNIKRINEWSWNHMDFRRTATKVQGRYRFHLLHGQQLIEKNTVRDYETGAVYDTDITVWQPRSSDDTRRAALNLFYNKIPRDRLFGRVFALDTVMENSFGVPLLRERYVVKV